MMPTWLFFVACILAVYRLAYMITSDNGPAHVFRRARAWVEQRFGAGSWQFEGATCFMCQSVWYGGLFGALWFLQTVPLVQWVVLDLAFSGGAMILHWLVLTWMAKLG